jgi:topoisomerase-4 subunit B
LGEISPDEFKNFIGETIRLDPVMMDKNIDRTTVVFLHGEKYARPTRIIKNLKVELDVTDAV